MTNFVHLRNHTPYSLAEGMLRIPNELVPACIEMDMPAVAITDTNNMFGIPAFCGYVKAAGIQPIIGTQISTDFGLPNNRIGELVFLVQNETGYKNLIKLASIVYVDRAPGESLKLSYNRLVEYSDGLIVLSGGATGPIGVALLSGQKDRAEQIALELKYLFGDRFYMEISRHGEQEEDDTEDALLDIAYKHDIPIVATNNCFYLKREMARAHDILMCIAAIKYHDDPTRRILKPEYHFKSPAEMEALFADLPEAIENTVLIARRCAYSIKDSPPLLPHVEKGVDESMMLLTESRAGLEERLERIKPTEEERKVYLDRLAYETGVIMQMGFSGYFLIVADFIKWAKREGIPVGPGRGSGAGSLVAYSLQITDLNPLDFGLLFERMLNPDRVSMPDFDIDFCQDRRDEVIAYVQRKYGFDSVGQIVTYGKLQAKAVIKDVGRVLRIPYSRCDELARLIPFRLHDDDGKMIDVSIQNCIARVHGFREIIEGDEIYSTLINTALKLEGLYRNPGIHAAGIIIGDRPLNELVPLYKDEDSTISASQFDMKYIEQTGLIKYDFLGLKTLSVIKSAVEMIKQNRGIDLDINNIPIDDPQVYDIFARGNTTGIFQFESEGMQRAMRDMKPDKIEDLIALNALYRPGPMENIPLYNRRKFGEPVEYLHPWMEPILKETYGIMVYQEQVMEIGRKLAGYTLGGADILRRAMGKKKPAEMAKQRAIFKDGCVKNGIDEATAMAVFDAMEKFANYGFNKSHAACYSWIAYQTAYLKTHFFPEFMAASMTYDMNDAEKLSEYSDAIKRAGCKLLRPDINKSFDKFTVEDKNVRFALTGIKGVGKGVVQAIAIERHENGPYRDIADFIERTKREFVNRKMLEGIIKSGGFDDIDPNRAKLAKNIDYILREISARAEEAATAQTNLFATADFGRKRDDIRLEETAPWRPMDALEAEREVVGFYVSSHPLDIYASVIESMNALGTESAKNMKEPGRIAVAGLVESIRDKVSKNGKPYKLLRLSDKMGSIDALFFARRDRPVNLPDELIGSAVIINADIIINEDGRSTLFGNSAEKLNINQSVSGTLRIKVNDAEVIPSLKKTIATIPQGYSSVHIIVCANDLETTIALPNRLAITAETIALLRTLPGIKIGF